MTSIKYCYVSILWWVTILLSHPLKFSSIASIGLHTDVRLERLRTLTVTMSNGRKNSSENPPRPFPLMVIVSNHTSSSGRMQLWRLLHWRNVNLSGCSGSVGGLCFPTIRSRILRSLEIRRCANLISLEAKDSFSPSFEVLNLSSCPEFGGRGMLDNSERGLDEVC